HRRRHVEVALGGPHCEHLASGLPHLTERREGRRRHRGPELLLELALRDLERVLTGRVLALRDRPRAGVLASPEGAAHVPEQHLHDPAVRTSVEQDSGAGSRHPRTVNRDDDSLGRRLTGPAMEKINARLLNWASILEDSTREQALRTAAMPFIFP